MAAFGKVKERGCKMSIDWKRKLTSRKFWVAIADFVVMLLIAFGVAETEAMQISAIIMAGAGVVAYIVGEGLTDAASLKQQSTNVDEAESME